MNIKEMKVSLFREDIKSWTRVGEVNYKGKSYSFRLSYNEWDGLELEWNDKEPAWAKNWDEDEDLSFYLDELTSDQEVA